MSSASERFVDVTPDAGHTEVYIAPVEPAGKEPDTLDWSNHIPVPPTRPGGRVRVRLRKAERDHPIPAEDPRTK
jgi:hypothetical protein